MPDAPRTEDGYLALCAGDGKQRGTQLMVLKNIQLCYNVDAKQLTTVIGEAAEYMASEKDLLDGALSAGNSAEWKATKHELMKWLLHGSSWATDELFRNSAVPGPCSKEAMLRIAAEARKDIINRPEAYGMQLPVKREPTNSEYEFRRSAATSPARSIASATASHLRNLDIGDVMPSIPDIRTSVISFNTSTGAPLKSITMKNIVHPAAFNDRNKMLTPMDVVYSQLLTVAAAATGINETDLLLSFNDDNIGSQHELEAAMNDFANGVRQSSRFDIAVSSQETEQDLAIAQSQAQQNSAGLAPRASPTPSIEIMIANAGTSRNGGDASRGHGYDDHGSKGDKVDGDVHHRDKPAGFRSGDHAASGSPRDGDKTSDNNNNPATAEGANKKGEERQTTPATLRSRSPSITATSEPDTDIEFADGLRLDGLMENEPNEEEDVDDHEGHLFEYLQNRFTDSGAGMKAMRIDRLEWLSASETFGVPMTRLKAQNTADVRFIPIDPNIGLSPGLGLMAHQVVGADVIHDMNFGPQRGCIEQDHMGMGKTIQIMCAFFINLVLTHEAIEGTLLPPTQRLRLDSEGLYKNRMPRVGATFLSAYSNGVEPWPRDWVKIVKDSPIMAQAKEWRPKLIVLHESGPKLCIAYGGEANGLYSELTIQDLIEMLPRPDWNKARPAYSNSSDLSDGKNGSRIEYKSGPSRGYHPRSTQAKPSPTSARIFIVSTNKCWQSRLYDVVNKNFQAVIEIESQISKTPETNTRILRDLRANRRAAIHKKMKGGDGNQKNQVVRKAFWVDHKGIKKSVDMVCDLLYAAWVIVDEIHSAGGANTLTYTGVIDPFNDLVDDPSLRPAFTAITGTAMANGIVTVLTFGLKGLKREDPAWQLLPDTAVKYLKELNYKDVMSTWEKFTKAPANELRRPITERIKHNTRMEEILNVTAAVIATYFIGRDYESVDAWGQKLNLLDCTLEDKYRSIVYKDEYHNLLKEVEGSISSQIAATYAAAIAKWEDDGGEMSRKPKPKRQAASRVAPGLYQKAKVLATYPNTVRGLLRYQDEHPEEEPLLGPDAIWGEDLGSNNTQLNAILGSPQKILNSILYRAIDYICEGAAKSDFIIHTATKTSRKQSVVPNPRAGMPGEPATISYGSKYCVISNVRLCKAIAYARLVKEFGADGIVWVGDGTNKDLEVARWRKYYDHNTGKVDDKVQFMVAGLKMVCQSIDLVEGAVFQGLEPHSINAEARQVGYRGFRIGQKAKLVTLDWLVHSGSFVEEQTWNRNMLKNNFADQCRAAEVDKTRAAAEAADEMDTV